MRITIEYFRKVLSLTLAIIMVTGSVSIVFPQSSPIPEAFASHNANLFVSAENSLFSNTFGGPQVIEVIISDSSISDTSTPQTEPDVTVNGKALRMVQSIDNRWYGYFADRTQAQEADRTVTLAGKGLDFGTFCPNTSVIGASFSDTVGISIPNLPVSGGVQGTNTIAGSPACAGFASTVNNNHVLREPASLTPAGGSVTLGQIGLASPNVWPLIQLYDFAQAGSVVVIYNKAGGSQSTTLTFDTADTFATHTLDRTSYPQHSSSNLVLTDVMLNIDPTDEDSWTFGASSTNSTTFYQLFDENGLADADGTSGAVDISPALSTLMFGNNGEFTLSGTNLANVLTILDNNDQKLPTDDPTALITSIGTDGGSLSPGSIPVTFTENGDTSGVFINYDENDKSNILVKPTAPRGQSATATYNSVGQTILVANFFGTVDIVPTDAEWNSGEEIAVTLVDGDANKNSLVDEDLDIFNPVITSIPSLRTGTPFTLSSISSATLGPLGPPPSALTVSAEQFSDRARLTTVSGISTGPLPPPMSRLTLVLSDTFDDLYQSIHDPSGSFEGNNFLNYDVRSLNSLTSGTVSAVTISISNGTNTSTLGGGPLQGLVALPLDPSLFSFSGTGNVQLIFEFMIPSSSGYPANTTMPIVADFFSYGYVNSGVLPTERIANQIIRFELEETGDNTGSFAGTITPIVINQLSILDPATYSGLQTISATPQFIVIEGLTDEDSPRVNYRDLGADGVFTQIADQQPVPSHTGDVALDSATYLLGDTVVVTLQDPDLDTDVDLIDIYTTVAPSLSEPASDMVGKSDLPGFDYGVLGGLLEVSIGGERWVSGNVFCAGNPGAPDDGLHSTGFTLVETGAATGIFNGDFIVPNTYCKSSTGPILSADGKQLDLFYLDFRNATNQISPVYYSSSIQSAASVNTVISDQISCESFAGSGQWSAGNSTCLAPSFTINSGDSLTVASPVTLTNFGMSFNYGIITTDVGSQLINVNFLINNSTLNNSGIIINNSTLVNGFGGLLNNSGSIENYDFFVNDETIDNFGTITNNFGGTIANFGTINNQCSAVYTGTAPSGNPVNNISCPIVNGKIVFSTSDSGPDEIYIMNSDGTGRTRLTTNGSYDYDPQISPDGTKIIFVSERDGNAELYSMNADGSGQTRLTNNSVEDLEPSISPDGTQIAFVNSGDGDREIYRMPISGGASTQLTFNGQDDRFPSWSPDGAKIVYGAGGTVFAVYQIATINSSDGSGFVNLSSISEVESEPSWSPDGAKIAYLRVVNGFGPSENYDVFIMNADGTGKTNLSNHPAGDDKPAFSPDGTKIAFKSTRNSSYNIFTMNLDGSSQTNISLTGNSDNYPFWSSVPNTLNSPPIANTDVFTTQVDTPLLNLNVLANDTDADFDPLTIVEVITTNGGVATINATNNGIDFTPDTGFRGVYILQYNVTDGHAPGVLGDVLIPVLGDNGKIAFSSTRNGDREIFSMNSDGTDVQQLTFNSVFDSNPVYSPNGTKLVYVTHDGDFEIVVMDVDGTNPIQLTSNTFSDQNPKWSPDGSSIVFDTNRDANNEIYVLNATGQFNLSNSPGTDDREPSFNTDGLSINYQSNGQIFKMTPDGSNQFQVITNPGINIQPQDDFGPESTIVFANFTSGNPNSMEIISAKFLDSDVIIARLTNNNVLDNFPSYSPDNSKIIFSSNSTGILHIFTMNPDGTGLQDLSIDGLEASAPSWGTAPDSIINAPPIASDDYFTTDVDIQLINLPVLLNDTDVDFDALTIVRTSSTTSGGTALINSTLNGINYTAPFGFIGIDKFNYNVTDGIDGFAIGNVTITVLGTPTIQLDQPSYLQETSGYVTVSDGFANANPLAIDSIDMVISTSSGSSLPLTIYENNINSGVFVSVPIQFTAGTTGPSALHVEPADNITATYQSITATATVKLPSGARVEPTADNSIIFNPGSFQLENGATVSVYAPSANFDSTIQDTITGFLSSSSYPTGILVKLKEDDLSSGVFINPTLIPLTSNLTDYTNVKLHTNANDQVFAQFPAARTEFSLLDENGGTFQLLSTGNAVDIPVAGDWDGDNLDSVGYFRPSTNSFTLLDTTSIPLTGYAFENNVDDAFGTNNGLVTGTPSYTSGVYGTAFSFDGATSISTADAPFDFESNNPFSVSTWFKTSTAGTTSFLFGKMSPTSVGYQTFLTTDNQIKIRIGGAPNTMIVVSTGLNVRDGNWHNVAVTYDGSANATGIKLYVDGISVPLTILFNAHSGTMLNDAKLVIGNQREGAALRFTGQMDDFRVYNFALSSIQASQLFTNTSSKSIPGGNAGDIPIAGDWDGDNLDSVGYFRPSTSTFTLLDVNGNAYNTLSNIGLPGDIPVAGDWNDYNLDSVGYFRPSTNSFTLLDTTSIPLDLISIPLTGYAFENNVDDAFGTNNGLVTGTPSYTSGVYGTAFSFDGATSISTADAPFDFESNNPFSVSTWFKTSTAGTTSFLFGKMSPTSVGYQTFLTTDNQIKIRIGGAPNTMIVVSTGLNVRDGNWHNVAVTYDGSANATGIKLYVDGISVPLTILFNAHSGTMLNDAKLVIGNQREGAALRFTGQMDDFRVYNFALSSIQASQLFTNVISENVSVGTSGNIPIAGDWDGNGITSLGLVNPFNLSIPRATATVTPIPQNQELVQTFSGPQTALVCDESNNIDGICESWIIPNQGVEIELVPGAKWTETCDLLIPDDCPSTTSIDVYLEIDYMTGHRPSQLALDKVVEAFKNSPVNGGNGINLHVLVDEDIGRNDEYIKLSSLTLGDYPTFIEIKNAKFGTVEERAQGSDVLAAKAQIYHYALWANALLETPSTSGYAEIGGNDIIITMGSFTNGIGSVDEQAGTLMHELGHNLNLFHGGADNTNYKPNYLSVMNYQFQFPPELLPDRPLDYSRKNLAPLIESSLDENAGIDLATDGFGNTLQTIIGGIDSGNILEPTVIVTGQQADFNRDGSYSTISQNIHYFNKYDGRNDEIITLMGHDDWNNLDLNFRDSATFLTGYSTDPIALREPPIEEITIPDPIPAPDVDVVTPFANSQTILLSSSPDIILSGADPNNNPLSFAITTSPTSGVLSAITPIDGTSAKVTYTPGLVRFDSFNFTVSNGPATSLSANVTLIQNSNPVTSGQTVSTDMDIPITLNLLATDADADLLQFTVPGLPTNGVLGPLTQNGAYATIEYTPNPGFTGTDSIQFKARDNWQESNIAEISIDVNAELPVILSEIPSSTGTGNVSFESDPGAISLLEAIAPDDPSLPSGKPLMTFDHGLFSFVISGIAPGSSSVVTITYPSPIPVGAQYWKVNSTTWTNATSLIGDNDGDNTLTLTITDGGFGDADGIVNGEISDPGGVAILNTIVANDQTIQILEDTADVEIVLTADPQTNPLTFTILSQQNANLGTFIQDSLDSSKLTYIPFANKNGQDVLVFSATDGTLSSNDATVTINVTPVNDVPTVPALIEVSVLENQPKTFVITASDVDTFDETDPDYLGFQLTSIPTSNGQITSITNIDATSAEFVYTPNTGATGTDTFTYYVTDRSGVSSDVGTVNLTIEPIVVPPTPLTLQEKKQDAASKLDALDPSNTRTEKLVDNAIRHITKSTSDELWNTDEDSVDVKHGKKVFNEEAIAVKNLMKILMKSSADDDDWDEELDDNEFSDDSNEQGEFEISDAVYNSIQEIIDLLVGIDKKLADDAIEEASSHALSLSGKDKKKADKHLEEITKSMQQAQEKLDDGKLHQAILKYKKAWENAQSILKL